MSGSAKVVKTKLFIGNLNPTTQAGELFELFGPFGNVLEASVIKDYGFVHYGTIEEAEKAVAALNNKELHGKRLRVELSTSTVRHRPGQPEPASALRNSRARVAAMTSGNGVSRYSQAAPTGGVGPMRHSASAWIRSDARPYDGIPIDLNAMTAGYGPVSAPYDHSHPYDSRPDPRSYYSDRHDGGFDVGYDASHDNLYGAPRYTDAGGGGEQAGMYSVRDYREAPPHVRSDNIGYGANRIYDHHQGASPVDPYYSAGLPPGPPAHVDSYQKFYPNRSHDSEYPISTSQNPSARDYDLYPNYRVDPYVSGGQVPSLRHDVAVAYPQQQQLTGYPPPTQPRQQQTYDNASSVHGPLYAPARAQYYGTQQRA